MQPTQHLASTVGIYFETLQRLRTRASAELKSAVAEAMGLDETNILPPNAILISADRAMANLPSAVKEAGTLEALCKDPDRKFMVGSVLYLGNKFTLAALQMPDEHKKKLTTQSIIPKFNDPRVRFMSAKFANLLHQSTSAAYLDMTR